MKVSFISNRVAKKISKNNFFKIKFVKLTDMIFNRMKVSESPLISEFNQCKYNTVNYTVILNVSLEQNAEELVMS